MKETLEADAFVTYTNRCPIMILEGNKTRSLESLLKDVIHKNLTQVTNKSRWRSTPPGVVEVGSFSAENLKPHTKKLKITIEIEE
jgi:hypothetical protein